MDVVGNYAGCDNDDAGQDNCTDNALTVNGFTYSGTDYKIVTLYVYTGAPDTNAPSRAATGNLTVWFDTGIAASVRNKLTLHVGTTALPLADAFWQQGNLAIWTTPGLPTWADGDAVSLRLTEGTIDITRPVPEPEEQEKLDLRITPESDRLHLRWNAVTDAKIYIVQWRKDGERYNHGVSQGGSPYTITSLEPGTLYYVRVSASRGENHPDGLHITYGEKSERTTDGGEVRRPEPEPEVRRPAPVGPTGPTGPVTGPGTTQPQEPPAQETSTDTESSPDRAPLLALYRAAGGENWENNWYTGSPIDDWHGVRTNEDRRVTELDLSRNGLSGEIEEITEEIGKLSYLETLDLSGNPGLSGELPSDLMELEKLETLDIQDTGLCVPGDEEFQMWLDGIVFHGEYCPEETADSGEGGCSVSSLEETGDGTISGVLGLFLVSLLVFAALGRRRARG